MAEERTSGEGFLYTRGGDAGDTGLLGGERVPKWDLQPEAYGAIDEATSALGLARALGDDAEVRDAILAAQRDLYRIMAELATGAGVEVDPAFRTTPSHVAALEERTDAFGARITLGREFVVPGETAAGAALDVARTIVRRAERQTARLAHERGIGGGDTLAYLNRLSSLLFVLARYDEQTHGRLATAAKDAIAPKRTVRRRRS